VVGPLVSDTHFAFGCLDACDSGKCVWIRSQRVCVPVRVDVLLAILLAVVASRDPTGRLSPLINLMIGAGLGLGPTFYAVTLKTTPNFRLAVPYAIVVGAISSDLPYGVSGDPSPLPSSEPLEANGA